MAYAALPFKRAGSNNWMVYNWMLDQGSGRIVDIGLTHAQAVTLANVLNVTLMAAQWAAQWRDRKSPPRSA